MNRLEYRFWSKVDIRSDEECWNFTGAINSDGYGKFWLNNKEIKAHRLAWELHYDYKVPKGKIILHHCDNPSCCNHRHLYCGTHADNMNDMYAKGRGAKKIYGHAKLSAKEIIMIRELKEYIIDNSIKNKYTRKNVAKLFKVSEKTIWAIWKSKVYPCKEGYLV